MQDLKLRELVDEVSRLTTIYNQCDPDAAEIAGLELDAAKERVNLYIKERKNGVR